jgi:ABC-2 type transport system ATP-binding protein
VTHSMDTVLQFCNKAMLIDKGHDMLVGKPLEIAQIYRELNNEDPLTTSAGVSSSDETSAVDVSGRIEYSYGEVIFGFSLIPKVDLEDTIFTLEIFKDAGEQVFRWASDEKIRGQGYFQEEKACGARD